MNDDLNDQRKAPPKADLPVGLFEPKESTCRGCGRPVIFAKVEGQPDKTIPLDPRPPVYEVQRFHDEVTYVRRHFKAYVSHFATCPAANEFSASRKRGQHLT